MGGPPRPEAIRRAHRSVDVHASPGPDGGRRVAAPSGGADMILAPVRARDSHLEVGVPSCGTTGSAPNPPGFRARRLICVGRRHAACWRVRIGRPGYPSTDGKRAREGPNSASTFSYCGQPSESSRLPRPEVPGNGVLPGSSSCRYQCVTVPSLHAPGFIGSARGPGREPDVQSKIGSPTPAQPKKAACAAFPDHQLPRRSTIKESLDGRKIHLLLFSPE